MHLVVTRSFADLERGDVVTDDARVAEILSSEHAHHVVRVSAEKALRSGIDASQREKN
jgi:hypothetical protein